MRGFQLWLNLPSQEKMKPAAYQDIPASRITVVPLPQGGTVKIIAGTLELDGVAASGPVNADAARITTDPLFIDVRLPVGKEFSAPLATGRNAFLYVYEGSAQVGAAAEARPLPNRAAGVLSDGDALRVTAGAAGVQFLLLAARPLREPVVQHGPFVMNTRAEMEQALADYRDGRLGSAG